MVRMLGKHIHTSLRNGANCLEIERGRWTDNPLPEEYVDIVTFRPLKLRFTLLLPVLDTIYFESNCLN